jgi:hypothetical protein
VDSIKQRDRDASTESECYNIIADGNYRLYKLDEALLIYEKALRIAKEIGDKKRESKCCSHSGSANFEHIYELSGKA